MIFFNLQLKKIYVGGANEQGKSSKTEHRGNRGRLDFSIQTYTIGMVLSINHYRNTASADEPASASSRGGIKGTAEDDGTASRDT